MIPNVKLLRLVLKHIEMAPCTWDQREWRRKAECGTVMCFAGWACTLAGGRWVGSAADPFRSFLVAEDDDDPSLLVGFHKGDAVGAIWRGQRVLGLDRGQADRLFAGENTLADLHRIVDEICAGVES